MSLPALTASTTIFVPVIGHRGDDAVDLLVVQQLLIAARRRQVGAGDFAGERVAAIVEIAGGGALDTRQRDGPCEQAGALHPDADHAEAHAVARGHLTSGVAERRGLEWEWFTAKAAPTAPALA